MKKIFSIIFKSRNIYFKLVALSLTILIISALYFPYYSNSISSNWESFTLKEINNITEKVQERFLKEQNTISKQCENIRKELISSFNTLNTENKSSLLLEILNNEKDKEYNFQVFNDLFQPITWTGSKVLTDIHFPTNEKYSSYDIVSDNFRKFLVYTVKIELNKTKYYLSALKSLETNYYLQNEFIRNESFIDDITKKSKFKFHIVWDTSTYQRTTKALALGKDINRFIRFGDGKKAFHLSIQIPDKDLYIEEVNKDFSKFQKIILLFAFIVIIISLIKDLRMIESNIIKVLVVSVLIWLFRIVLLIIDFTSFFEGTEIANPSVYASRFGFGLVKSPLDLFLTASALVIMFLTILFYFRIWFLEERELLKPPGKLKKVTLSAISIILILITPFALRATGAIFRSFVFDSSIKYFEQRYLIPDITTSLMYYNVFIAGILIISFIQLVVWVSFVSLNFWSKLNNKQFFLILFLILSITIIIFNLIDKNPQFDSSVAIIFILSIILGSLLILEDKNILSFRSIIFFLISASVFSSALLFQKTDLQERELQKTIANELLRPRDELIRFALNQTLQHLATDEELIDKVVLNSINNSADFNFVAYKYWVNSILSDEGLNSYILIFNKFGKIIGSFGFGMGEPIYITDYFDYKMVTSPAIFVVRDRKPESILGISPIRYHEQIFGYVGVLIEIEESKFSLNQKTTLFQNIKYEKDALKLIPEIVVYTLNNNQWSLVIGENFPIIREVSDEFLKWLERKENEFWINERIDGRNYQSYIFVSDIIEPVKAISISSPQKSWTFYVFNMFKLILVHIIISFFVISIGVILLIGRGYKFKLKFKTKLFAGLFIVTLFPILLLAYFTRESELKRWTESLSSELKKDLDILSISSATNSFEVKDYLNNFNDLIKKLQIDFNLYSNYELIYSTQNKLYEIEFFSKHIPYKIYNDLIIENKNYTFDFEYISNYPYLVGYKKINAGKNNYILSIPTIYKQEKLQRDLAQIDTFVLGSYSLTLILIFIFGNLFFERITKPISQLTEATKKVSEGDLSVKLDKKDEDEVGDLIDAFNIMIRDLEESRKKLARAEREYAWKEMAKQVAHEIKNPLTPMKLSLQHLQVLYKENKKEFARIFGKVSTTLVEQIETLTKITNEFSHYARMPDRYITKCNLEEILIEIVNLFSTQVKISLESIKNETFLVFADREELKRVFINLVKNSVQANSTEVKLKLYSDANYCFINVEDNGMGIPNEYKDKLFEPSFSTKTEGTGIGLAIVKKIIDELNGSIEVKSEIDKGTIVMIALPKAE